MLLCCVHVLLLCCAHHGQSAEAVEAASITLGDDGHTATIASGRSPTSYHYHPPHTTTTHLIPLPLIPYHYHSPHTLPPLLVMRSRPALTNRACVTWGCAQATCRSPSACRTPSWGTWRASSPPAMRWVTVRALEHLCLCSVTVSPLCFRIVRMHPDPSESSVCGRTNSVRGWTRSNRR